MSVVAFPAELLGSVREEARAAAWFAALGAPLDQRALGEAKSYGAALDLGPLAVEQARDWPQAEAILKAPNWEPRWWDREEALRRSLLAEVGRRYPERVPWRQLSELTSDTADLVYAKAQAAAARAGNAAATSIHVAAGAASQAIYQLGVARLAGCETSLFNAKFRLFTAGHWPLGVVGPNLLVF